MPDIALLPSAPPRIRAAVEAGGGRLVEPAEAEAVIWFAGPDVAGIRDAVASAPKARWVQLPWAGVEALSGADLFDDGRTWTSAKGVYAEPCAELALALLLAGLRGLGPYARAGTWTGDGGVNLLGTRLVVIGGGGIASSFVTMVQPFRPEITVVRASGKPMEGVANVVTPDQLVDAAAGADGLVVAAALTPATTGIVEARLLSALADHSCVVNVARGRHVVTDHLVEALVSGSIGSAGLDVTDPEPLPDAHPLWEMPNVVITPHTGNSRAMGEPLVARRIQENVERFGRGDELLGLVDPGSGY